MSAFAVCLRSGRRYGPGFHPELANRIAAERLIAEPPQLAVQSLSA
jgi:hypothetical protein